MALPRLRRGGSVGAVLVLTAVGAWLGLRLLGGTPVEVGPLLTSFSVSPDVRGGTRVQVDPVGSLELDSHLGPRLHVSVNEIDAADARRYVADPALLQGLRQQVVKDVRAGLLVTAIRDGIVATLAAGLLTTVVLRSWRRGAASGGVALLAVLASYALAAGTWDPSSVQRPRFQGLAASLPSLVGDARRITSDFDVYADQLGRIVTGVSRLYTTTLALPVLDPAIDYTTVLHTSDLHLNPAAWQVVSATVKQFHVDVVVDSGDIADHGSSAENAYVGGVRQLGVPYVYVRGNHDSPSTERAVARQPEATVLSLRAGVRTAAGLRFLGAGDPRFTPDKDAVPTQTLESVTRLLGQEARAAGDVDVLVIHDPADTALLDGVAPLVLAGHLHQRSTRLLPDGTHVMVEGSTGGAGLRALQTEEPTPVMLSVLYLDPTTRRLAAWDEISLGGLGLASATIERHLVGDEDERPRRGEVSVPSPTEPTASTKP